MENKIKLPLFLVDSKVGKVDAFVLDTIVGSVVAVSHLTAVTTVESEFIAYVRRSCTPKVNAFELFVY